MTKKGRSIMGGENEKLTSAEVGKLWETYMGNTLFSLVLRFFIQHCEDQETKQKLQYALDSSKEFVSDIRTIYTAANHPIPHAFTENDVNMQAPRLFSDEFYLYYLKYVSKAGLNLYSIAVPLMTRPDIRKQFRKCLDSAMKLTQKVNDLIIKRNLIIKPPIIPIPNQSDFVKKQNYLNGYFRKVRPLNAWKLHIYTTKLKITRQARRS